LFFGVTFDVIVGFRRTKVEASNENLKARKETMMGSIRVKDGTTIYYKDWGKGQPVFFHHVWPLSADDWDPQMMFFLERGFRVIAHDRRGHGRSTQTDSGNERTRTRLMSMNWFRNWTFVIPFTSVTRRAAEKLRVM
jgi:pimeloyl-ACP methyl ester carboxylesterase